MLFTDWFHVSEIPWLHLCSIYFQLSYVVCYTKKLVCALKYCGSAGIALVSIWGNLSFISFLSSLAATMLANLFSFSALPPHMIYFLWSDFFMDRHMNTQEVSVFQVQIIYCSSLLYDVELRGIVAIGLLAIWGKVIIFAFCSQHFWVCGVNTYKYILSSNCKFQRDWEMEVSTA